MSEERPGRRLIVAMAGLAAVLAACSPTAAPSTSNVSGSSSSEAAPTTLVLAPRGEPLALAPLPLFSPAGPSAGRARLFNASLTYQNGAGEFHPYLAEALPELNTDSWKVFPDGTMETTFRLRPNASWHDGTPLRALDFVFGWQLVSDPDLGMSGSAPHNLMQEVSATDDRTLRIRWRRPFPDAAHLDGWSRGVIFVPLPRHQLEGVKEQGLDAFRNHSFWTAGYVGAGPYGVERWETGSFLEARAFDGHVTGRPKIDRLKVLFLTDANVILSYIMAGELHVPIDQSLPFAAGLVLKQEWAQGSVEFMPSALRRVDVQHRQEYASPPAIRDIRVRRALAYAIDKPKLNEALHEGLGIPTDTIVMPTKPYFPIVEQAITRYPFDPRRSAQLMSEAGFTKDRDGMYSQPGPVRLNFELLVTPNPENETGRAALAAGWRDVGFDVEEGTTPRGQGQNEATSTFRSFLGTAGDVGLSGLSRFTTANISRAETRWVGDNTGGWSNPEYDRAVAGVETALDPAERVRYLAEAARVMSEDLGSIFLYYSPMVVAFPTNLQGISLTDPQAELTWNIHEWEFK